MKSKTSTSLAAALFAVRPLGAGDTPPEEARMKSRRLSCITAIALFCLLVIPVRLAAQEEKKEQNAKHRHYKVIEVPTLGGPNFFAQMSGAQTRILNNRGTLTGGVENAVHDPRCFNPPECVELRAIRWDEGKLTDLGTLPGGANSAAFWISDTGEIAGLAQNGETDPALLGFPFPIGDQVFHAAVWKHGKITDLGTLGGPLSLAQAVNNRGQVVGLAQNKIPEAVPTILYALSGGFNGAPAPFFLGTQFRAFLWEDGEMQDLGTLGGPEAWARTINDRGQIAGVSFLDSAINPVTGVPTYDAFFWEDGKMTDLGNLGGTQSDVQGLNNRGQVIGEMTLPGELIFHPFFWDEGKLTDLGTFGGDFGLAIGLNEEGEVVGTATNHGGALFAFLWKDGILTNLGTAPGDDCSVAQQINSRGQAVGPSFACAIFFSPASDATLFEHGEAINLNDFVPPGSGFHLTGIDSFINDRGEIAVSGALPNGDFRIFMVTPCDEGEEGCVESTEATTSVAPNISAAINSIPSTSTRLTPGQMKARRNRRFGTLAPR
jgi:probable HAF family extracellular repeat protein